MTKVSKSSVAKIRELRKNKPQVADLTKSITEGDAIALSRGITMIESQNKAISQQADELVSRCLPHCVDSLRIGITGVPGVGKSTFIEAFGNLLTDKGHRVAVLAVDPTSSLSKGSILGDKTRMESLVKNENAFIRPTASGSSLGGVAQKTRESIILCEAAKFDVVIVETVGVGQSETSVHGMTDFFLLLKIAGAGDELQGMKRGIIEMADMIAINKADGENQRAAEKAKAEFNRALHLYPKKESGVDASVKLCSSLTHLGLEDILNGIKHYQNKTLGNGYFYVKRKHQNKHWFMQTIEAQLKRDFFAHRETKLNFDNYLKKINNSEMTPFQAAEKLLRRIK
jgi:LAO/AO transport system kinase